HPGRGDPPQEGRPQPKAGAARTDLNGAPLPRGVLARFGTPWERSATLSHLAFSHDGKFLILAADFGYLRLWDVATGLEVGRFLGEACDHILAMAPSPDGKRVATSQISRVGRVVAVWDVAARKRLWWRADSATSIAFSPDGGLLAAGTDSGAIVLRDAA